MKSGIKVTAPASVSNLACGFDTLGLALDLPCDEIIGRWVDAPGLRITEIRGYKKDIPADPERNTAGVAAMSLLRHLREDGRGLELRIHKHIQCGSGLGSSASSAVAAVMLVNEMLNRPLEKRELLPFALDGEVLASGARHGDNVVPAMIGGLILVRDIELCDYHRIYMPPGLFISILLPAMSLPTREARRILQPDVPLPLMVRQAANLASFVIGMHNADFDLIRRSLTDHVVEPQRKHLIPHFDALKDTAMRMGALGCSISGAGPAVFALCQEKTQAAELAAAMQKEYDAHGMEARSFATGINPDGVRLS